MPVIERSSVVPFSAEQMLALVNDIDAYPDFLHWCHAARVENRHGDTVDAAMEIGISGIYKTIRTRNETIRPQGGNPGRIEIQMIDGPLKSLHGTWEFTDRTDHEASISLRLNYEVHLSPLGMILRTLFDEIANSQLHAFVKRAHRVYGNARD